MATILKRGPAQWQAKIRRAGYPAQSRTFETRTDAERWARDVEGQMDRRAYVDQRAAEQMTLREALRRYRHEVTPHKKGAYQEAKRLLRWEAHELAARPLAAVRSADVAAHKQARAGRAASTIRNELNLLSQVFEIARKEWGIPVANPCRDVSRPRLPQGRDRRLIEGEEARLLEACQRSRAKWLLPAVILLIETGMRLGELHGLMWTDIDGRVAKLRDTKNGERRSVPLSLRAKSVLDALPRSTSGRVIPSSQVTIQHAFKVACGHAAIDDLRLHDLRHEATSRFFESGLDMMKVASITGHKTLAMLRRYTHLRAEDLVVEIDALALR